MSIVDNETFKSCFCDGSCKTNPNGQCGQWYGPGKINFELPSIHEIIDNTHSGFTVDGRDLGIYRNFADKLRHLSETAEERQSKQMREAAIKTFNNLKDTLISAAENGQTSYTLKEWDLSHDCDEYLDYLSEILEGEGLVVVHYDNDRLGIRWDKFLGV